MLYFLAKSWTQSGRKDGRHASNPWRAGRKGVQFPASATRGGLLDLAAFLSSIFVYSLLLDIKMDATDISLVNTKLVQSVNLLNM